MNFKISTILKSHWPKILSVFLFIILLGAYANIFAIGSPYSPGSTLNPECAPGEVNCTVSFSSWLTGTSNIYHNGNVNVGSDTASVSTQTDIESTLNTITLDNFTNINYGSVPSITLNKDGNPVIVYLSGYDILNILTCLDSECSDFDINIIENNFSYSENVEIVTKIDSNNLAHIVLSDDLSNAIYISCINIDCSNYSASQIFYPNYYAPNFSLDENNNPFIVYNSQDSDTGNSIISIASYTGSGNENTCEYLNSDYSYGINQNWKCKNIVLDSNRDIYLSYNNSNVISGQDNSFSFIAEIYDYDTSNNYLSYFTCDNFDCENLISSNIDILLSDDDSVWLDSSLSTDDNGIPYVAYSYNGVNKSLKLAHYVGGGSGSGCSESNDWTCSVISSVSNEDYSYGALDIEIGSDSYPRISVRMQDGAWDVYKIDYLKCLDINCQDYNTQIVYSQEFVDDYHYYYPIGSQIVLDEDNQAYFAHITVPETVEEPGLQFVKETITGGDSFDYDGDDFFTFGDVGIKNNLFVDNKTVLGGGLYFSNYEPDVTNNALYNNNGDLYWDGKVITIGNILSSTSGIGTETWLGNSIGDMGTASSNFTVFLGLGSGVNATSASYSNFIGYEAGWGASNAQNANFMGYHAGYNATNAFSSTFLGAFTGKNATNADYSVFLGNGAGDGATSADTSVFLGFSAGYHATLAANSIFIGHNAGYWDYVNNTTSNEDYSILIGNSTSTNGFKNSIAIGNGAVNTANNQFMIGSTNRPINKTVWKGTSVTATLDTATGLSTSSDERLKTNIHILNTNEDYMDYASSTRESYTEDEISDMTTLEKVLKITPVRYDWREDPDNEYIFEQDITPENIGFIAQDLINFFPEVVYPGHDENKYLGVNYANMTPILVEAIKEMNLKVESINTLEDEEGNLIENSWRDSFIAWFENIENGIRDLWADRIHAKNELCIGEGIDEVCLNPQELREIKDLIDVEDEIIINPKDEDPASPSTGTGE